jgi:hypothetical protein
MTDSKRQTIVDAIDARFKTILVSPGGYETNLGANVFPWKTTPFTDDELPGLAYRDLDETNDISIGQWEHAMMLEIDIHVFSETDAMAALRAAIKDVVTSIGSDTTFGGLTEDVVPAERDFIRITQNDGRYAGCTLSMIVLYLTNRWAA